MAARLRVNPNQLRAVAAGCEAWAPKLATGNAAPGAALTGPAVSAALAAIRADGFRAGGAGGARMHSTVAGLTAAVAEYDNHESREDYTVTDRQTGGMAARRAERRVRAQKFAADIVGRVIKLTGLQHEVAGKLTITAAGIRELSFDESPMPGIDSQSADGHDRPADYGSRQSGGRKVINIDPDLKNGDPARLVSAVAHEMGHALSGAAAG